MGSCLDSVRKFEENSERMEASLKNQQSLYNVNAFMTMTYLFASLSM